MKPLNALKRLFVVLLFLQASLGFAQTACDPNSQSLEHFQNTVPQFIQLYLGGYCISDSISDTTIYMRFYPQGRNGVIYWGYSSPLGYPLTVTNLSIYNSDCIMISQGQAVSGLDSSLYYVRFDIRTVYVDNFCPYFLSSTALAVDFGLVRAEPLNDVIQVSWVTLSEENSHYFTVEYSYDLQYWRQAASVDASGNSSTDKFYYTQIKPPYSGIVYIRVVEYDYNGNTTISSTIYTNYNTQAIYNKAMYDLAGRLIRIGN
jgi:hypothetical protein